MVVSTMVGGSIPGAGLVCWCVPAFEDDEWYPTLRNFAQASVTNGVSQESMVGQKGR